MKNKEFKEKLREYLEKMIDFEILDKDKNSLYGIYRGHTLYFQSYIKGIKNDIYDDVEKHNEIFESILKKISKSDIKLKKLDIREIGEFKIDGVKSEEALMSYEEREKHYKAMIKFYENKLLELNKEMNNTNNK